MKTFISWVVANVETFVMVLTLVIGALIVVPQVKASGGDFGSLFAFGALLYAFIVGMCKSFGYSIGFYLCILLIVVFGGQIFGDETREAAPEHTFHYSVFWGWFIFIISSILGGLAAVFANNNFYEVVSRRMLWRNSNVSMYEERIKYVINRFCATAGAIFTCIALLVLL